MKRTVNFASAEYSGAGIYIYYGSFADGMYFISESNLGSVLIVDSDSRYFSESLFSAWQKKHTIDIYEADSTEAKEVLMSAISYILHSEPHGNYLLSDIRNEYKRYSGGNSFTATDEDENACFYVEYETEYIPKKDVTIIFRHVYNGPGIAETSICGFYYGEPDSKLTKTYATYGTVAKF